MDWKFALVLVFSLIVAVFTIQNAESVDISFLGFEFTQVSQALVILISAASGALIALLFGTIRWVKDKTKYAAAKRSIAALETQVKLLQDKLDKETLKNAPPLTQAKTVGQVVGSGDGNATSSVEAESASEDPETAKENTKAEEPVPKKKWFQL